jgi:hypothetical protein
MNKDKEEPVVEERKGPKPQVVEYCPSQFTLRNAVIYPIFTIQIVHVLLNIANTVQSLPNAESGSKSITQRSTLHFHLRKHLKSMPKKRRVQNARLLSSVIYSNFLEDAPAAAGGKVEEKKGDGKPEDGEKVGEAKPEKKKKVPKVSHFPARYSRI